MVLATVIDKISASIATGDLNLCEAFSKAGK